MSRRIEILVAFVGLAVFASSSCDRGPPASPAPARPTDAVPSTLATATPNPVVAQPPAGGSLPEPRTEPTRLPGGGGPPPPVNIPRSEILPAQPAPLAPIATIAPASAGAYTVPTPGGAARPLPTVIPAPGLAESVSKPAAQPQQGGAIIIQVPTAAAAPAAPAPAAPKPATP